MSLAGIGIDLIEIDRFEHALARSPRLRERLFTPTELDYAEGRARPAQHLAARFCAKEAVAKSLGLAGWSFNDVEVVAGEPPSVRLAGRAEERARHLGVSVLLSLTHDRHTAAAVACAEGRADVSMEPRSAGRVR
jgi:holo-[acyl-carrier protein] synthase